MIVADFRIYKKTYDTKQKIRLYYISVCKIGSFISTNSLITNVFVDLEGIEPSSKRGNHKLSTCLSLPKFSCRNRTKAINSCLIL